MNCKVITFNIGTGAVGTTVTVTPGFPTKLGLVFLAGRTDAADANGAADHSRSYGFFVGTTSGKGMASASRDAIGTADANSFDPLLSSRSCIVGQQLQPSVNGGHAFVQSITATQVVFEIAAVFPRDYRVTGVFLGGDDIDGEIVQFTATGTAPVNQEIATTNVPRVVFVIHHSATADNVFSADSKIGFGYAQGTGNQDTFAFAGASNEGSTSGVTESYLRDEDFIVGYAGAVGSITERAAYVGPTVTSGNGFTINWAARTSNIVCYALVLSGTFQSATGEFTTQTDTTTDMTGTTGFPPKAMLFVSHNKAKNSSGALSAHDKWSMGAATGTGEQHCQAMADRDANTDMFVSTAVEHDQIYVNMDEVNRTLQGAANLTAVSATGFTARMTDADPSAASVMWVALGDAPGNPYHAYAQQ